MKNNSHHEDIVRYLEALHASRHLIADAYCNGSVDIGDESVRSLRQLQELRVMRIDPNREEAMRLSPRMVKVLDQVVNRIRSLQIAGNLSEQMARLNTLSENYLRACHETDEEHQDIYSSDFEMAAYELSDHVDEVLMNVDFMANNNFANVSNYAEKLRQNTHYLKQMKRLVETLSVLRDQGLLDMLESCRELQPLFQQYEIHILRNMNTWRAKLHDIIGLLERYMGKMREIEPFAKRIRMFSAHLHRHPDYAPKDPDDYPHIPEWAYRHEGITIEMSPDILDDSIADALIPVAHSIERTNSLQVRERRAGQLRVDDENLEEVIVVTPSPFDIAVADLVEAVKQSPSNVSARHYFTHHEQSAAIDPAISLMCLTALLFNPQRCERFGLDQLHFNREELPLTDPLSGNITVLDYQICRKA